VEQQHHDQLRPKPTPTLTDLGATSPQHHAIRASHLGPGRGRSGPTPECTTEAESQARRHEPRPPPSPLDELLVRALPLEELCVLLHMGQLQGWQLARIQWIWGRPPRAEPFARALSSPTWSRREPSPHEAEPVAGKSTAEPPAISPNHSRAPSPPGTRCKEEEEEVAPPPPSSVGLYGLCQSSPPAVAQQGKERFGGRWLGFAARPESRGAGQPLGNLLSAVVLFLLNKKNLCRVEILSRQLPLC
jgi:hypothetical protein